MAEGVELPAGTEPALLEQFEALQAENRALKEVVQQLEDEIAQLKGKQGQSSVPPRAPQ